LSVALETRVVDIGSGQLDYECAIVDTSRRYDNGAFTYIQLQVQLRVYVIDTMGLNLTLEQVTAVVRQGFDRGHGGWVKFRALLRDHPDFASLEDVRMLKGKLDPPARSVAQRLSGSPLYIFSTMLSELPPKELSNEDDIITQDPTVYRTLQQRTVAPTVAAASGQTDRRTLTLAVIAGGVATILVSCFFIVCIWFPFCRSAAHNDVEAPVENNDGRYGVRPRVVFDFRDGHGSVPHVVQLDSAETDSLANTTLAEHSVFPSAPNLTERHKTGKNSEAEATFVMFNSFDERSFYEHDVKAFDDFVNALPLADSQALTRSLNRTFENDKAYHSTNDVSSEDFEFRDPSYDGTMTVDSRESGLMDGSDSLSISDLETIRSDNNREERRAGNTSMIANVYESFAEAGDAGTSGSSSFDFQGSLEDIDAAILNYTSEKAADAPIASKRSTLEASNRTYSTTESQMAFDSSSSTKTRLLSEHLLRTGTPDEEKNKVDDETGASNDLLRSILDKARLDARLENSASTGSGLSPLTEPPRLRGNDTSTAHDHDKVYDVMKSRLNHSRSVDGILLRNPTDFESPVKRYTSLSSMDPSTPKKAPSYVAQTSFPVMFGKTSVSEVLPYRTRFFEHGSSVVPHHFVPMGTDASWTKASVKHGKGSAQQSSKRNEQNASSESYPSSDDTGKLGAEPRNENWMTISGTIHNREQLSEFFDVTSVSKDGMSKLEASSLTCPMLNTPLKQKRPPIEASLKSVEDCNPWLFDAIEQTLGPRSPMADMESISGISSNSGKFNYRSRKDRFGKSHRQTKSYDSSSLQSFECAMGGALPVVPSVPIQDRNNLSEPSTARPINTGSTGETRGSSASDERLVPRNLDHDLKCLDDKVGTPMTPETEQLTGGSSISASSACSTISSKKVTTVLSVPPGKLGVLLVDRHDGRGTVVSDVRGWSSMYGKLFPGDQVGKFLVSLNIRTYSYMLITCLYFTVSIDDQDVSSMLVSEIVALMASKVHSERRLTILTITTSTIPDVQDPL
jgi:hypothetical protein